MYSCDKPALGQAYIGRDQLLRSLRDAALRGRSLALCGGPKLGRTSSLLNVQATLRERWRRQPKETKVVPLYVRLTDARHEGAPQLAERLWRAIEQGAREASVSAGGAPPPPRQVGFARTKTPFELLTQTCAEWSTQASGTTAWGRQAWLLDDADALLNGKHEQALAFLATLIQKRPAGAPDAVVLAGGRRLHDALLEKQHPLSCLRPLTLGVLSSADVKRLVHTGLPTLPASTLEELEIATGRHPYALQTVLARLEAQSGTDDLAQALTDAHETLTELFTAIWEELDLDRGLTYRGAYAAPEHALMQLLIDSGAPLDVKSAESQLGMESLREFALVLEYVGVAERALRGDVPTLRAHFRLWNEWYRERIRR